MSFVELGVGLHVIRLELLAEGHVELIGEGETLLELIVRSGRLDVLQAGLRIGDRDGAHRGGEETSAREGVAAVDDDAVRKGWALDTTEEVGGPGTDARMDNRATRLIAGLHDIRALIMHTRLGAHGTDDGELVGHLGHLHHRAAEAVHVAGTRIRLDWVGRALGGAVLWIPGVDVSHTATHPEEDDVFSLAEAGGAWAGGAGGSQIQRGHDGHAECSLGRAHHEVTTGDGIEFVECGFHK